MTPITQDQIEKAARVRITENEWKVMLSQSESLQRLARQAEMRGDKKLLQQAWSEMGPLHKLMRSDELVVVREDGSTF